MLPTHALYLGKIGVWSLRFTFFLFLFFVFTYFLFIFCILFNFFGCTSENEILPIALEVHILRYFDLLITNNTMKISAKIKQCTSSKEELCEIDEGAIWESRFTCFFFSNFFSLLLYEKWMFLTYKILSEVKFCPSLCVLCVVWIYYERASLKSKVLQ